MSGRPEVVTVDMEDGSPATVKVTTKMWTTATDSAKKTLKKHWNGYSADEQVEAIIAFLDPIAKLEAERREKEAEKQRADGAEARLSARDAAGTLLSLLLLSPVGLVTRLVETKCLLLYFVHGDVVMTVL
jgi:hypothetical protein